MNEHEHHPEHIEHAEHTPHEGQGAAPGGPPPAEGAGRAPRPPMPPWMWRARGRRRRGAFIPPLLLMIGLVAMCRRACRSHRPDVGVFVGVMFRPTVVTEISLLSGRRRGRRRLRFKRR